MQDRRGLGRERDKRMDDFVELDTPRGEAVAECDRVLLDRGAGLGVEHVEQLVDVNRFARLRERDRGPGLERLSGCALFQFEVLQADRRDRQDDRARVRRERLDVLFELQFGQRGDAPGLRILYGFERADDTDAVAGDAHLVGLLQRRGFREFDVDVVRGDEREPVVGVVGEVHGDDHDQRGERPDQQRAGGE